MWCVPYSGSNYLGVGVKRGSLHVSSQFDYMYDREYGYYFKKREYDDDIRAVTFCDYYSVHCVWGKMDAESKAMVLIKVMPMCYDNVASNLRRLISRSNYNTEFFHTFGRSTVC